VSGPHWLPTLLRFVVEWHVLYLYESHISACGSDVIFKEDQSFVDISLISSQYVEPYGYSIPFSANLWKASGKLRLMQSINLEAISGASIFVMLITSGCRVA
jgi:hypothetical protein